MTEDEKQLVRDALEHVMDEDPGLFRVQPINFGIARTGTRIAVHGFEVIISTPQEPIEP